MTRLYLRAKDVSNTLTFTLTLTNGCTANLTTVVGGTTTTLGSLPAGAIPSSTAAADYNFTFSVVGDQLTATLGAQTATSTIPPDVIAALASATIFGVATTDSALK